MAVIVDPPTVADLQVYAALTGANYPVEELSDALDTAATEIEHLCVIDPYEAPLAQATMRRAMTILTGRGAPLGLLDTGTFGMSPMLRWDPELGKLIAPYLRGAFA